MLRGGVGARRAARARPAFNAWLTALLATLLAAGCASVPLAAHSASNVRLAAHSAHGAGARAFAP